MTRPDRPLERFRSLLRAWPFGLAGYLVLRGVFGPILWPINLIEPLLFWIGLPSLVFWVVALARKRRKSAVAHALIALNWLWLFGHAFGPERSPASGEGLCILSFNLAADLAPPARVITLLREARADLVLLQELGPVQGAAIELELATLYPYRDLHPLGIPGMGLLSRHPILEVRMVRADPQRDVQRAVVDIDGVRTTVYNVHADLLHTWLWPFGGGIDVLEQLAQEAVRAAPSIVGGDFNATENMEAYRRLARSGLMDVFHRAGVGPAFTFPVFGRYRSLPLPALARIDTIWCTENFDGGTAEVLADAGSDHYPVLVRLPRR